MLRYLAASAFIVCSFHAVAQGSSPLNPEIERQNRIVADTVKPICEIMIREFSGDKPVLFRNSIINRVFSEVSQNYRLLENSNPSTDSSDLMAGTFILA